MEGRTLVGCGSGLGDAAAHGVVLEAFERSETEEGEGDRLETKLHDLAKGLDRLSTRARGGVDVS